MKEIKFYINNVLFPGIFAFFFWGFWAYYSNLNTGTEVSAFFIQGITSFIFTFYLAISIEVIFKIFINNPLKRIVFPTFITSSKNIFYSLSGSFKF